MATVLVVDEASNSRRFLASLLSSRGHQVREASDAKEALNLVRSQRPELMLVDILTPDMDDWQLIFAVRSDPALVQPRVLLMAGANAEAETRAMAQAFEVAIVAKPPSPETLVAVVSAALAGPAPRNGSPNMVQASLDLLAHPFSKLIRRVAESNAQLEVARTALELEIEKRIWAEQELTRANQLLQDQAMRDVVTGLHNRRYLDASLAREESRARRMGRPMAIMMIDIDHFKIFNDILGHAAGDKVLNAVGQCMVSLARGEDIAARYGGDEFALLMVQATRDIVWQRADALCQSVRNLEIGSNGQQLGPVTLSVGMAIFPDHGASGHEVLQVADEALIRSKMEGRDRVVMGDTARV